MLVILKPVNTAPYLISQTLALRFYVKQYFKNIPVVFFNTTGTVRLNTCGLSCNKISKFCTFLFDA